MPPLPTDLRRKLENTVVEARDLAEAGARNALRYLAVTAREPHHGLSDADRSLREALITRARSLGDVRTVNSGFDALVEEVAYEQWHRMLFARFLAENHLLMHPTGVSVTLDECRELAAEEGEPDEWMVAAKYAAQMLPGIFRREDPSAQVRFALNDRQPLENLLAGLSGELFQSDDALGWVYQFWQTKAKKEVNASGRKIGGKDLPPVTQLFTENYMVRFLLENSLGAWWAVRHPDSPLLKEWEYLRFREDGTPAAGVFDGWPETAAEVTVMDPCCGSGHFLVAAADMLRKMRMEEEGLSEADAAVAVIRDNLHGLELDPRCTQIAAFALVFDAWKHGLTPPVAGGEQVIPNIACSGIPVEGGLDEWRKLAGKDTKLLFTLERLYNLFRQAPDLGSLIDPNDMPAAERMFQQDYAAVASLVEGLLGNGKRDPVADVFGSEVRGVARAANLLAGRYTLVVTNPPYLSRGKQAAPLRDFADAAHPEAKADIATMFIQRCRTFAADDGAYAMVTPQNWLFLGSYRKLREQLLHQQTWGHVARLGAGAFDTVSGEVVNVALGVWEQRATPKGHVMTGLDASGPKGSTEKAAVLRTGDLAEVEQAAQLRNPSATIEMKTRATMVTLGSYARCYQGIGTGDINRYIQQFWEIESLHDVWEFYQSAPSKVAWASGMSDIVRWERGRGELANTSRARICGQPAWERSGFALGVTRSLHRSAYLGPMFDCTLGALIPNDPADTRAIAAFVFSDAFYEGVKSVDQALSVTESSFEKVPFDLEHWQKVAEERYPDGLPEPHSDDPTQWLFPGNIVGSESPLQVAVARLLGYRWPDQPDDSDAGIESVSRLADDDGIVCLPPVAGEQPAAERLRAILAEAHSNPPSGPRPRGAPPWPELPRDASTWIEQLLADAGSPGKSLEQWLRDDFFEQHFRLFHHRPFTWHIWDGLRDGFSALVNYHQLDYNKLQKLTYTYLGWWIDQQGRQAADGVEGAAAKHAAALDLQKKLAAILEGEDPYDIFVRWKPIEEQPIGWHPDLDDGVRLNIRPFMTADVLRKRPNINWKKDRGKNPPGSPWGEERHNDVHLGLAEKRAARAKAGK